MPVHIDEVTAEVPEPSSTPGGKPAPAPQTMQTMTPEALRAERERETWRQSRLSAD